MTRDLNTAIGSCELTFSPRVGIDTGLASQQHQQYQAVLSSLGCRLVTVPTQEGLADSVFIEDTALVLDEIAILCRPGAVSRQAEVAGVREFLQQYRPLASILPPGTLDGGDLLRIGKTIYAGLSTRSNETGIRQLRSIVEGYGYSVDTVKTAKCLHLKSAVSQAAPETLLINPDWIDRFVFRGYRLIDIDRNEAHAANALLVEQSLVYPTSFPRTMEKLLAHCIDVKTVDVSELQKAEGAVTCCSLVFATGDLP